MCLSRPITSLVCFPDSHAEREAPTTPPCPPPPLLLFPLFAAFKWSWKFVKIQPPPPPPLLPPPHRSYSLHLNPGGPFGFFWVAGTGGLFFFFLVSGEDKAPRRTLWCSPSRTASPGGPWPWRRSRSPPAWPRSAPGCRAQGFWTPTQRLRGKKKKSPKPTFSCARAAVPISWFNATVRKSPAWRWKSCFASSRIWSETCTERFSLQGIQHKLQKETERERKRKKEKNSKVRFSLWFKASDPSRRVWAQLQFFNLDI